MGINKMNYEVALERFIDKFIELHPKNDWPRWFRNCTTYGGKLNREGNWVFSFTAVPSSPLKKGEQWELSEQGNIILTSIDENTGEKNIVISNTAENIITLFEVEIKKESEKIKVLVDKDLFEIKGDELQPLRG